MVGLGKADYRGADEGKGTWSTAEGKEGRRGPGGRRRGGRGAQHGRAQGPGGARP